MSAANCLLRYAMLPFVASYKMIQSYMVPGKRRFGGTSSRPTLLYVVANAFTTFHIHHVNIFGFEQYISFFSPDKMQQMMVLGGEDFRRSRSIRSQFLGNHIKYNLSRCQMVWCIVGSMIAFHIICQLSIIAFHV